MNGKTFTGLEAIKFMEQGGTIIEKGVDKPCIYKIEDEVMWVKNLSVLNGYWEANINFDLSISYEEYVEPKKLNGWERAELYGYYFVIEYDGVIYNTEEDFDGTDQKRYDVANYFIDATKAEEINFKQTLFRKLQRFSDENGGNMIEWHIDRQAKWCIEYKADNGEIVVIPYYSTVHFGQVYFISDEVAQQAIELFYDDLIKYFTM